MQSVCRNGANHKHMQQLLRSSDNASLVVVIQVDSLSLRGVNYEYVAKKSTDKCMCMRKTTDDAAQFSRLMTIKYSNMRHMLQMRQGARFMCAIIDGSPLQHSNKKLRITSGVPCSWCGKQARFVCACECIMYCSEECQQEHLGTTAHDCMRPWWSSRNDEHVCFRLDKV